MGIMRESSMDTGGEETDGNVIPGEGNDETPKKKTPKKHSPKKMKANSAGKGWKRCVRTTPVDLDEGNMRNKGESEGILGKRGEVEVEVEARDRREYKRTKEMDMAPTDITLLTAEAAASQPRRAL